MGQACKLQFVIIYPFTNSALSLLTTPLNSSDSPILDLADFNRRLTTDASSPISRAISAPVAPSSLPTSIIASLTNTVYRVLLELQTSTGFSMVSSSTALIIPVLLLSDRSHKHF